MSSFGLSKLNPLAFRSRRFAVACIFGVAFSARAEHSKTVAVIGDSVATGAVSSPNVDARLRSLVTNFVSHRGYLDFDGSQGGVNYPENAFSQIVASGFGVKPQNVINLAKNGDRVDSIATQFQKFEKLHPKTFPNYIFLSFTANDACGEEIFETSAAEFKATYLRHLLEGGNGQAGIRYIAKSAPKDRPTSLFLLASLNFPQVLTNPRILSHEVPLHFSTVRCERFRTGDHTSGPHLAYLADKLRIMCPAVLGTDPKAMDAFSIARRSHLQTIHRTMVQAQAEAIEILKRENTNRSLSFRFIAAPANVDFNGTHVANDCFHLSNQGQGTLGMAAWAEIFDGL